MDYKQTIEYLFDNLPMFHRIGPAALKNDLSNIMALDEVFGHAHGSYKTIHVAGTNGKGSVSHLLAAVLQLSGYKTGLFTSPHLKDFRERIRVNGRMISEEEVVVFVEKFIERNQDLQLKASFFELTTAMAFDHFRNEEVDIAVIETGMGGRLDSTNIIKPILSIITNISFDHTSILGNTLEKIAIEKAGIIKSGIPVVIGEYHDETQRIFRKRAEEENAILLFADQEYSTSSTSEGLMNFMKGETVLYGDVEASLKGDYQRKNFLTVIAAIELLKKTIKVENKAVLDGFASVTALTGLQGRWQKLGDKPVIICDTGHNEAGIRWIMNQLQNVSYEKLHIVFGVVNDKDVNSILALLPKDAVYYFTKASIERALNETTLKSAAESFGLTGLSYPTVYEALEAAKIKAGKNDFIFVGGSTFVVAEIV